MRKLYSYFPTVSFFSIPCFFSNRNERLSKGGKDANLSTSQTRIFLLALCLIVFSTRTVLGQEPGTTLIWVDDKNSWDTYSATLDNLEISEEGLAVPNGNATAYSFHSKTKQFASPVKATELVFEQSDVWDNWIPVANVGPNAGNAPVLISVKDGEYYFLGSPGGTTAYHAFQSSDMINWIDRGPVTGGGHTTGRWVTSAEYKDGQFYIYYDATNDEKPTLVIDDDLTDGMIGTVIGTAYDDPTNGSDCSVFRDNSDNLFHIIYEDWTPINARNHSWDSPLAGHVSSPDGINGFIYGEHPPVIDHRTTPTGTFGTYIHPQMGMLSYEIHQPEQDAYGDYTTIKVGEQYYIFADYEQVGQGIRLARFTSNSLYQEFELVGSLGNGHPDPTVAFAEGQFYLLTQQNTDYVSPGPWVDGVTARAGVDIDANGTIDQWTAWQTVKESYDHNPEYIRVVDKTPAALNLSSLPKGYGFQFEFRVDNTVVPGVSPLMDRVSLLLEGDIVDNVNLAFHKPTQQSSTDHGGNASRAVDGNTNGLWSEGSISHTQRGGSNNPWWRVDLEEEYAIGEIKIFNRTDVNCSSSPCGSRLSGAKVYVGNIDSSDPNDFTEIATLNAASEQSISPSSISGRYILIYHPGSYEILSLAEVEVYGELPNLAYQKPAIQSSTDWGGLASRAVDGNTSGLWSAGSISHTQRGGSLNPWWRVDLQGIYSLEKIEVFNRTNCCSERLDGAKVLVGNTASNNPSDYTEIGVLNSNASQSFMNLEASGRYIMVYLPGNNKILSIAEVRAFGNLAPASSIQNFTASIVRQQVQLSWNLSHEMYEPTFRLERSIDGVLFEKIALVDQPYSLNPKTKFLFKDSEFDYANNQGELIYRISFEEKSGPSQEVQTISLDQIALQELSLFAYPAPVDQLLSIEYESATSADLTLSVRSHLGKRVFEQGLHEPNDLIQIDASQWAAGIYFVSLSDGHQIQTTKVMKIR